MKIKDNINCLFQHCIQALGEEHPIRVVNALQVPQLRDGKCSLLLLMRQYVCLWYQASCSYYFSCEEKWCLQSSCYFWLMEVTCARSLCNVWGTLTCSKIQGGNGVGRRGLFSLQAVIWGLKNTLCGFVCLLLSPLFCPTFYFPCGSKLK